MLSLSRKSTNKKEGRGESDREGATKGKVSKMDPLSGSKQTAVCDIYAVIIEYIYEMFGEWYRVVRNDTISRPTIRIQVN